MLVTVFGNPGMTGVWGWVVVDEKQRAFGALSVVGMDEVDLG